MTHFGDAERQIASLLTQGSTFTYNETLYTIQCSGKPTCSSGEPKTDIYVLVNDQQGNREEFKISYKKENADFLENKITAIRAQQIWDSDWTYLTSKRISLIRNKFDSRPLIFKSSFKKTSKGAFTLGWKFEVMNVQSGNLSNPLNVGRLHLLEIYAGNKLNNDKKNALVNGKTVENSGVANYILIKDSLASTQEVIDNLIPISTYIAQNPNVYFACKALNYRSLQVPPKWDGDRPLAVYVDWSIVDNRLSPTLKFDEPLITKGNEVAEKLRFCLNQLGINNTNDINPGNVSSMSYVYE